MNRSSKYRPASSVFDVDVWVGDGSGAETDGSTRKRQKVPVDLQLQMAVNLIRGSPAAVVGLIATFLSWTDVWTSRRCIRYAIQDRTPKEIDRIIKMWRDRQTFVVFRLTGTSGRAKPIHTVNGRLHEVACECVRPSTPMSEYSLLSAVRFECNRKLHRELDAPALVTEFPNPAAGSREWYVDGLEHRDHDRPASMSLLEDAWYQKGQLDREGDQPATVSKNGSGRVVEQYWYQKHKQHRDGGQPAVIQSYPDREQREAKEWWTHGHLNSPGDDLPSIVVTETTTIAPTGRWHQSWFTPQSGDEPEQKYDCPPMQERIEKWHINGTFARLGGKPTMIRYLNGVPIYKGYAGSVGRQPSRLLNEYFDTEGRLLCRSLGVDGVGICSERKEDGPSRYIYQVVKGKSILVEEQWFNSRGWCHRWHKHHPLTRMITETWRDHDGNRHTSHPYLPRRKRKQLKLDDMWKKPVPMMDQSSS
jgi:hypothetical protein